jgi:hypothetical protein
MKGSQSVQYRPSLFLIGNINTDVQVNYRIFPLSLEKMVSRNLEDPIYQVFLKRIENLSKSFGFNGNYIQEEINKYEDEFIKSNQKHTFENEEHQTSVSPFFISLQEINLKTKQIQASSTVLHPTVQRAVN